MKRIQYLALHCMHYAHYAYFVLAHYRVLVQRRERVLIDERSYALCVRVCVPRYGSPESLIRAATTRGARSLSTHASLEST